MTVSSTGLRFLFAVPDSGAEDSIISVDVLCYDSARRGAC